MAPSATSPSDTQPTSPTPGLKKTPLKSTGSLDAYKHFDVTPIIGTEFPNVNLVNDILPSPQKLRDLAITISERGVVFFRAQDNLTNSLQKDLMQSLGLSSGKPPQNTLHIHPVLNDTRELGGNDPHISTISSVQRKKLYEGTAYVSAPKRQFQRAVWHSDISFEHTPADYTSLRLTQLPSSGGDTLWAYLRSHLATLSLTFHDVAARGGFELHPGPRGSEENTGTELIAHHPVVRTNPVTGWKSLYSFGPFVQEIDGLAKEESEVLLKWFGDLIFQGHDLTVRFKWVNENDVAIWDNRSVFHTATNDYDGLGDRFGNRAVGIAEVPYFDPASKSRDDALRERAEEKI